MRVTNLIQRPKNERDDRNSKSSKNDLINFVGDQFKQLVKKNLRIPVKLYHL